MNLKAGLFLKSTPTAGEPFSAGTLIFITEHNANGAVGFVINHPFGRSLNELEEFRHSPALPLYWGGPVDKEHLFFLHRRPGLIDGGTAIVGDVYSGGNFRQVVAGINNKSLTAMDIKVFVGYCGWDSGDLEGEIEEGSWMVTNESADVIFHTTAI